MGSFIGKVSPVIPLPLTLKEAMYGDLLGDGQLRFN
jgi:hypothetical protein